MILSIDKVFSYFDCELRIVEKTTTKKDTIDIVKNYSAQKAQSSLVIIWLVVYDKLIA